MIVDSSGDDESRWLRSFPFSDDFESVLKEGFSWADLEVLSAALRVAIDSMGNADVGRVANVSLLRAVAFAVAAQQRCQVAMLYRDVVEDTSCARVEVLAWMQETFQDSVIRDNLVLADLDSAIVDYMCVACSSVWTYYAMAKLSTAEQLAKVCLWSVRLRRWTVVTGVLVDYEAGRTWDELTPGELVLPVMPAGVYREIVMRCMDGGTSHVEFAGHVLTGAVVDSWIWLLRAKSQLDSGYCYLKWFHPAAWRVAVDELGKFPYVSAVMEYMSESALWTSYVSEVKVAEVLHVVSGGLIPKDLLGCGGLRVGGSPVLADPYATALVEGFLRRHTDKPISPVSERVEPVEAYEPSIASSIERTTLEISEMLHKFSGVSLSPRAKVALPQGFSRTDGHHAAYDSDRMAELYSRLECGAVISEDYFSHLRSRLFRRKARPRLDSSGGRVIHVFKNYSSDYGGSSVDWRPDKYWDVNGWCSFVMSVNHGDKVVIRFVAPSNDRNVRIDFTGEGDVNLKSVNFVTEGTVLWFTGSITFELYARQSMHMRLSYAEDDVTFGVLGTALRCLAIPGFSYYYCGYNMMRNTSFSPIDMRLQPQRHSAFDLYKGDRQIASGMAEYRMMSLSSSAPAKVIIATEPVHALHVVRYAGVRFYTTQREYVSLLVVNTSEVFAVSVAAACKLKVSAVQVVNDVAFDAYRDAGAFV